ncbi:MAG TPA: ABC transporter permease [Bacteroidales bacterium]|nr:ABC transporter permease [Bacteroidales bacterium]
MLILAWRNLWRNKRRTLITAASVFFAVFFAILLRGFHAGTWSYLIDSVLHSYTGYIQVHTKDFWENKSFDYSMAADNPALEKIKGIKGVKGLIPRIESFSLASYGDKTKGVITVGIDPMIENNFSALDKKIVRGRYFHEKDTGIILSERLANFLKVKVNDSLVLLSQGYQGASANGVFRIIGIVKLPAPEFDNQMVYMPLSAAQEFYSMQSRLTSVIVDIDNPQKMDKITKHIAKSIDTKSFEVMTWEDMLVELYQQYVSDEGGGVIMLVLLYIIVGFGVFGTVLMMISERRHEYAIMIALGMQRSSLLKLVGTELFYICFIGVLFGTAFSLPIITYFHFHPLQISGNLADVYAAFGMEPLLPVAWRTDYIIQQAINVTGIVAIVLLYPIYSVYKLDLTKAIRR